MTEEEKQLLLKDLSHRLLYGVKLFYYGTVLTTNRSTCLPTDQELIMVRPYLRKLSSLTEDELKELYSICPDYCEYAFHSDIYGNGAFVDSVILAYDWFDKNHVDYRGLIELGLAYEAPEGMYK
jgi:hypothetical protein